MTVFTSDGAVMGVMGGSRLDTEADEWVHASDLDLLIAAGQQQIACRDHDRLATSADIRYEHVPRDENLAREHCDDIVYHGKATQSADAEDLISHLNEVQPFFYGYWHPLSDK